MPAETHVTRGPMDRQAVFELIRDRLADILEIEPSAISEGASFTDDLDADSLALIELVEALEEELGERSVGFRIVYLIVRRPKLRDSRPGFKARFKQSCFDLHQSSTSQEDLAWHAFYARSGHP